MFPTTLKWTWYKERDVYSHIKSRQIHTYSSVNPLIRILTNVLKSEEGIERRGP